MRTYYFLVNANESEILEIPINICLLNHRLVECLKHKAYSISFGNRSSGKINTTLQTHALWINLQSISVYNRAEQWKLIKCFITWFTGSTPVISSKINLLRPILGRYMNHTWAPYGRQIATDYKWDFFRNYFICI